jgi:hypothetical protein
MWQMGEFDKNFMLIHTSSGMLENIIGDCGHTKASVKYFSWNYVEKMNTATHQMHGRAPWRMRLHQQLRRCLAEVANLVFNCLEQDEQIKV